MKMTRGNGEAPRGYPRGSPRGTGGDRNTNVYVIVTFKCSVSCVSFFSNSSMSFLLYRVQFFLSFNGFEKFVRNWKLLAIVAKG